jgi:hypothetical protein
VRRAFTAAPRGAVLGENSLRLRIRGCPVIGPPSLVHIDTMRKPRHLSFCIEAENEEQIFVDDSLPVALYAIIRVEQRRSPVSLPDIALWLKLQELNSLQGMGEYQVNVSSLEGLDDRPDCLRPSVPPAFVKA